MLTRILALVLLLMSTEISAQNTFNGVVLDSANREILQGAIISYKEGKIRTTTDAQGSFTFENIPEGTQTFVIELLGYQKKELKFIFPLNITPVFIYLSESAGEIEEIVIEGTRSNRSIENIPTRVEVLTEEIDEASTMDPSKVAHLLTHSTGIQVQQTSATSNTANVRIQGLDGRYTQILKDGFPMYGGFSGSLSIMQIPPLDLRQVEYIKGSASTLYGAGAIAGLINLLSKEPRPYDEVLLHINASHIGAFDVNAFTSGKREKLGYTLLAQRNTHRLFDADKDGFSDLPELTKYNFNPKLFFYFNGKTKMYIGATITNETRKGGDMQVLQEGMYDSINFYKEENDINRITSQIKFDHNITANKSISFKNSFNIFNRSIGIISSFPSGEYLFTGKQLSSFSEFSYACKIKTNVLITGFNFYTDEFNEQKVPDSIQRKENLQTLSYFANYTFDAGKMMAVESGIRADYNLTEEDFHILPRVSVLFKWTPKLTTRMGGGMGYRNATIFNQEAEISGYRNILSIDRNKTKAENSYGANADIGFKTPIGEKFFLNINQMFFYNHLQNPLVLADTGSSSGVYEYINADGYTQSYGAETFFKLGFYDFVLFVGYTYTNVTHHFADTVTDMTLTPKHSLKGDLLYALPGKWRVGADYEYKSEQKLSNGKTTPAFLTFGVVVEYTHANFTLFGNVENYTNVRQTNYESLISAPYNTPQFTEVWAPLDGIVFNTGIKIRL